MRMADLRFGVIGWGYWGPKIARNLDALPHAMVAMVADMEASRLASLGLEMPRPHRFDASRSYTAGGVRRIKVM